ncbi:MAG: acyltransferase [Acidobacteriia bacterium]|nr:acyltransferase [Terriglobia bacterium]
MNEASSRVYRPELDLLRFGAFLLVFLHHALPHSSADYRIPGQAAMLLSGIARAGALGVDLFFALSAYLITELLLREQRSRGAIDIRAFYIRRILRIWPLYYFALLILVPAMSLLPEEHMPWSYSLAFALFGGNWACAAWGYPPSSFALLWSVSIEEQFYIAWPWIMRMSGRLGAGSLRLIACGMLAIATVTRIVLVIRDVHHPGIWCNTLARLDPIAGGALLACFLNGAVPRHSARSRSLWIGLGGILLVGAGSLGGNEGWPVLITYPLAAAASVAVIVGTLGSRVRAGAYLGKISYGLYVFHAAAIRIVPSPILALPLTMAIAAVSYRYLESPFLRLKERYTLF